MNSRQMCKIMHLDRASKSKEHAYRPRFVVRPPKVTIKQFWVFAGLAAPALAFSTPRPN